LMRKQDIEVCESLGVDLLGFVVEYPREVPWNLTRKQTKKLIAVAKHPTCLVTGGSPENVIALAKELQPDMVQLHFKETVSETAKIAAELKALGIKTIKAVDSEINIGALCETDLYAILVDSRTPDNAANNTHMIDTDLFNRIKEKSTKPLIIAGGITPENVHEIINHTRAEGIDALTGVEYSPGVKNRVKIEALVNNARAVKEQVSTFEGECFCDRPGAFLPLAKISNSGIDF